MVYTIYTDGGCDKNPGGNGGCGVVIINGEKGTEERYSFAYDCTTNNRMEMRALIHALLLLPENPGQITVHSDSQYVINTLKRSWKRNVNLDLWEKLDGLIAGKDITYRWVKGHNGNMYNEICDQLATQGINNPVKLHDDGFVMPDYPEIKNVKEKCDMSDGAHEKKTATGPDGGAMSVKIDIPASYNKHADISVRASEYASRMNVSIICAESVIAFYKKGRNSFNAYAALRSGGRDMWSCKTETDLIHEFGQDAWNIVSHILDDKKLCEYALRWYGRGLSLSDSIRKVLVDKEIDTNAKKNKNI